MNSPNSKPSPRFIQNVYLTLTLFSTLAASFIWGINTLFQLDGGLTNAQAFLANAFFTAGMMLFEIPTGVVADLRGRRLSYLLGTITLVITTLIYVYAWSEAAPFWVWAVNSVLTGLGFTFFSGATEAWLVDALHHSGYEGELDEIFARGQSVYGVAMLVGALAGGWIAQASDLGMPFLLRAVLLAVTFAVGFFFMRDWGWEPEKSINLRADIRQLFSTSIDLGLRNKQIRWVMLAAPFAGGVGIYVFYAMQPHLLTLFGDSQAYGIAGLTAAIMAGAQIVGGLLAPSVRRLFPSRTSALLTGAIFNAILLFALGQTMNFWLAVAIVSLWALFFAAVMPLRQAYLNEHIPSKQRATVLSFDALMSSAGGVAIQPALGRTADLAGYLQSFMVSSGIYALAVPLTWLAHRQNKQTGEGPAGNSD